MTAGGVWKLDTKSGAWTEITPVKPDANNPAFGWTAVSVDAHNPNAVIASTFGRRNSAGGEDELYRTIDGGKTWKAVFESGGYDYKLAPYKATTPLQPVAAAFLRAVRLQSGALHRDHPHPLDVRCGDRSGGPQARHVHHRLRRLGDFQT